MSSVFFDPVPITGHSTARSTEVNALFEAVSAGFEMLPTPTEIKQGKINLAGADSGATNAYVVSLPYSPGSYASGLVVRFVAANTNDGASTINVNGIGAAQIRNYAGAALTGGEIIASAFTDLAYDATNGFFRILNPVTAIASVTTFNISTLAVLSVAVSPPDDYLAIHSAAQGLRKVLVKDVADEASLVLASQVYGRR